MSKITCEHIPSRADVYDLLNNFLKESNQVGVKYTTRDTENLVSISFPSTELGINFLKYINYKKMQNNLFFKMKVKLDMQSISPVGKFKSKLSPIKNKKIETVKPESPVKNLKESMKFYRLSPILRNSEKLIDNKNFSYLKTKDSVNFLRKNLTKGSRVSQSNIRIGSALNKSGVKNKNTNFSKYNIFYYVL